jgi:acyl-CoA thioesterase-2
MTRPDIVVSNMQHLIGILDLEKIEENLFRGSSPNVGWQRVFGGLVISQALAAQPRTVADRFVHSLHSYFLRPGDPSVPFSTRSSASAMAAASPPAASWRSSTASRSLRFRPPSSSTSRAFEHLSTMPDMPSAGRTADDPEIGLRKVFERCAGAYQALLAARAAFRNAPGLDDALHIRRAAAAAAAHLGQGEWRGARDRRTAIGVLAYLSDMTLLDTSLFPHGRSVFDQTLQAASLDHAMWFHSSEKIDDWLLYTQDSPFSGGARGLSRGSIYNRSGRLIASVAQEGLIRKRAND